MKKTIFCLWATATVFLCTLTSMAQITLEHTFDEYVYFAGGTYGDAGVFICQNEYNIKLYNTDYSLYKNIEIIPPTGYSASIDYFTKKLFNDDNKIEFMVTFHSLTANMEKLCLCNEDGTILKDFGEARTIRYSVYKVDEQWKLFLYKYENENYAVEIYSLPGKISNAVPQVGNNIFQSPYPNPANSTITLPYQLNQGETSTMRIYNLNGQLIESKQIDATFDKILLNVSNYRKGLYLYEVNGVSKRFVVR